MKIKALFLVLVSLIVLASVSYGDKYGGDYPQLLKKVELPDLGSKTLRRVQFVDNNIGYVFGDSGLIYKTTDGGEIWTQLFTKTTASPTGSYFIDANTGWVAFSPTASIVNGVYQKYPASLKKTTDGGATFSEIYSDENEMGKMIMVDANNGYAFKIVKDPSWPNHNPINLVKTSDGGASWSIIKKPPTPANENELQDFSATDANSCVLINDKGEILKTTDGGNSWSTTKITIPTPTGDLDVSLYGVKFVDANNGWVAGDKVVFKTNDGQNWINVTPKEYIGYYGRFYAIDTKGINEVMITGNTEGIVLHTTDGGATWSGGRSEKNSGTYYGVAIVDSDKAFAVGNFDNGQLEKYSSSGEEVSKAKEPAKEKSIKASKKAAAKKALKKSAKKKKK